jgi:hypothetical protein
MIPIFLCGSDKDTEIINVLLSSLHDFHRSALHITAKTVSLLPPDADQADFLILENSNIQSLHLNKGLILFKSDISGCENIFLPQNFIAIVESDNEKAIELLKRNSLQAITCGLSQKDTLTFSSLDSEKAAISLQREIHSLKGDTILPHEMTLKLDSSYGNYSILAAVAVLLLSGLEIAYHEIIY